MLQPPPLSLYIHIPWCVKKCPYCDFNSHVGQEIDEKAYLEILLQDLDQDLVFVQGRELHSIFIGGGTPSLLSPHFYTNLIRRLEERLVFQSGIEITMEANPGTTDSARFEGFLEAGINRLSLGVQSFNDDKLKSLGRIHDSSQALGAIQQAQNIGFDNINLDLMHGLPEQEISEALNDLKQAIDLQPQHISWYQLTIEPNTEFYNSPPAIPVDDRLWEIQEQGQMLLQSAGFNQYEISAYARSGRRSKHNLNYWTFGDYLGIGAGAHGKVTDLQAGVLYRYRKSRVPRDYMREKPQHRIGQLAIPQHELSLEFMMNALRLTEGVDHALYSNRTGLALDGVSSTLEQLRADQLMCENKLGLTQKGQLFLNEVLANF